ncbi:MAG: TIGR00341 family protein [Candidatus Thorarchaeota archaeon]
MKQVQITVPYEKTETVFDFIVDVLDIKNVVRFTADNAHLLQFRIPDEAVTDTMEGLKSRGVGVEFGFIDILDLKASLPREVEESSETKLQREADLAVEEIYENVKKQASLSFDFMAFVIFAAVMAGFGLIQNNITIIVASMLLSPLMGPMLGVAVGYVVGDNNLFIKGTKNELIALGLSFAVGAIMAIMMPLLYSGPQTFMAFVEGQWNSTTWFPTEITEITRRGSFFSALDVGIAVFSGTAIAVSVTKGDMSTLVGVAISAALMPPAVNVGMMITLGLVYGSVAGIQIGVGSLILLAMNIILIDIAALESLKTTLQPGQL